MIILLHENQVLKDAAGRTLRLLWLPPDGLRVCLTDIGVEGGMPFWMSRAEMDAQLDDGSLEPVERDPFAATIRTDGDLTNVETSIRDKRLNYIRPLVDDPDRAVLDEEERPEAIKAHIAAHGGQSKYVYQYLRLWWRGGQLPNALVPAYAASVAARKPPGPGSRKVGRKPYDGGGTGEVGIAVTPEIAALMAVGRRFLDQGKSVKKAYGEMLKLNFSDQVVIDGQRVDKRRPARELPTEDQFIYHVVRKLTRGDVLKATKGDTRFARRNRDRTGTNKDSAAGPGSDYQLDATIADIYLRSHDHPDRLIGRPVIYIVIDVYSRMIVGFCVALSGPSWEVAKLALENAMTDKVASCAARGITVTESQWPARHVCRRLTMDRGTDVTGLNSKAAAEGLGYDPGHLPPYRPDWKGLVESRFDLVYEIEIKWAPGATHGRDRGEPKHQLDAVYTLATFTQLMINFIVHYNRRFEIDKPPSNYISPDGRAPTPLVLWNYGCRASGAPQIADRERVRANLLHTGQARETDKGLLFKGLHYQPPDKARMTMFRRIPGRKWGVHDIRFDPRDMASILLPVDRGAKFEAFHLTPADRSFAGWTLDEFKDWRAMKREGRRLAADDNHLADAIHEANKADLERRVSAEAQGVRLTPASARGIRNERAEENREVRREQAWTSLPAPMPLEPPPRDDDVTTSPVTVAPAPVAAREEPVKQTRMQLLAAAAEAARKKRDDNQ